MIMQAQSRGSINYPDRPEKSVSHPADLEYPRQFWCYQELYLYESKFAVTDVVIQILDYDLSIMFYPSLST